VTSCAGPYVLAGAESITQFAVSPSDTFVVSDDALAQLSMATPFAGSQSGCAHQGAHVQFKDHVSPYVVDVFAPADGEVTRVDTCLNTGANDRYGLSLKIATSAGTGVTFEYSLEPMGGHLCGSDPHAYERYLVVRPGDVVRKGAKVAQLFHPGTTRGATHIHFHLRVAGQEGFFCPNIFSDAIAAKFHASRNGFQCGGKDWSTFCFMPDPGEDLVHGK
jgi:hypothetical protein